MKRSTRLTALIAGFLLAGANLASAADKVDIRPQLRNGLKVGFDMNISSQTFLKVNGGQQVQGEFHLAGTIVYEKMENGQPVEVELTFDKDSSMTQVQNGQKQTTPFPLGTKTIGLKRAAGGQIEVGGAGNTDAATIEGLKRFMTIDTSMYPPGPVAVGDDWDVDPAKMGPEMGMQGGAKASLKCKLVKVGEIRGRKTYDITLGGTIAPAQQGEAQITLGGVHQIDAVTGLPAQIDVVMKISNQNVDAEIKSVSAFTFGDGAAAPAAGGPIGLPPAGILPPPGGIPPENPLDPRPANPLLPKPPAAAESPFAGAFKGDALAGDFTVTGDQVTGNVTLDNKKYPVVGVVKDGKLSGTFEAAGAKFKFVATLDGESMTFDTEGTKYAMKKQGAANPLARPRNPLEQP